MAELKKINGDAEKKSTKLTYEQLEAYAAQTVEQAKKIFQENQMLQRALYEQSLKEVEIALKCLDHTDKFSEDFIKTVVDRIEEIMDPRKAEKAAEEKTNKEE